MKKLLLVLFILMLLPAIGITEECYDFDGDNYVSVIDIMCVASLWLCDDTMPCYKHEYDFDDDGIITVADVQTVANQWGTYCNVEQVE